MKAHQKPVRLEMHGDVRIDPYFWMRERDSAEVLEYLKAENRNVDQEMSGVKVLREKLFGEMKGRIKEDEDSVPVRDGDYFYYSRFEKGHEYAIHARKHHSLDAREEVVADVNQMAKGHEYYSFVGPTMSPNHTLAAFAADSKGRRFYDVGFKDVSTNVILPDVLENTTGNVVWAHDNQTVYYSKQHPETLRAYQVYKYTLGSAAPELVYEEKDETFSVWVAGSKREGIIFINSTSTVSSEVRWIDTSDPKSQFRVIAPRERDHEYEVFDGGDRFVIVTNWKAKNFRLMEAPFNSHRKEDWKEIVAHRDDVLLEGADVYRDFMALAERRKGNSRILIYNRHNGHEYVVEFPEPAYTVSLNPLPNYDGTAVRLNYESLIQPPTVYDFDMATRHRELKKTREVPGYDSSLYESERHWATAPDGTKIPISLVHKKGLWLDGKNPLLLYGYGSYGISMEPWFESENFSLLDRGFVYAVAHIRGGSEMGRHWYLDGKLMKKKSTFTDFIACAEYLIQHQYTSAQHLHIMGGSAGGLLVGSVANMRPDLFKSVVAAVPFVDVVTTMLDSSIPLTTSEYDEWGNPNEKDSYNYMKSYSPYDNVVAQAYPNILVTTGYHDSQVQYWEPAKWVARLRDKKTDHNALLFFTEMGTGHFGPSGRFEKLKLTALHWAFLLKVEGITH